MCPFFLLFQFHDGTIKTNTADMPIAFDFVFQFHDGTIKTHRHL